MTQTNPVASTLWVDSLGPKRFRTGWRRVWAGVIDSLVLWPLSWIEEFLIWMRADGVVAVAWVLFQGIVVVAYSVGGHALFGATLGKAAMGVRVYSLDGEVPGWRRAALRDILLLAFQPYVWVAALPVAWEGLAQATSGAELSETEKWLGLAMMPWFLLELLTMLFSRRRRAVHDFIAGTVAVRTEDSL